MRTIDKVWGVEVILYEGSYTVKKMIVNPGYRSSAHFHRKKHETFVVLSGELRLELFSKRFLTGSNTAEYVRSDDITLRQGDEFVLTAGVIHRFSSSREHEQVIFLESSTTDTGDDNVRLTRSGKLEEDSLDNGVLVLPCRKKIVCETSNGNVFELCLSAGVTSMPSGDKLKDAQSVRWIRPDDGFSGSKMEQFRAQAWFSFVLDYCSRRHTYRLVSCTE